MVTFSLQRRIWKFHVVILRKTANRGAKKYYVCATHCTALSPLFSDVPVAVTVVVVNFLFSVNRLLPFNGELK